MWIYYDQWLVRRIKLRKTHAWILTFSNIFYYFIHTGIVFVGLVFLVDLTERIYSHQLGYMGRCQIYIQACWPIFLTGVYIIHIREWLKITRTKLGIIKIAFWRSYKDGEFDLAIEHIKQILETESDHAEAYWAWGSMIAEKACIKSGPERESLYQKANGKFEQALVLNPDDPAMLNAWGFMLADQARHSAGEQADTLFAQAYEKFEKAFSIKNDNPDLLEYWGWTFIYQSKKKKGKERKQLLAVACEKYEKGYELEGENYQYYNLLNWGWALAERSKYVVEEEKLDLLKSALSKTKKGLAIKPKDIDGIRMCGAILQKMAGLYSKNKQMKFLHQARKKLKQVEKMKKGAGAYCLACMSALGGEEEECRGWLVVGEKMGTLPSREEALEDEDLASVREKEWFQTIRWGKKYKD